ncbi:Hypothetical protein I596_1264 [Dokdonella koreensis DS-123]|uniref:Uncharacterized protein n=1 Tax=Dokdonella koreensis DS-123 TaxID=1300342 RepID=A0A160DT08_9GAMM|nr:Hypothetical protein I596_1264 [Dokdonella koreensis DS-123]
MEPARVRSGPGRARRSASARGRCRDRAGARDRSGLRRRSAGRRAVPLPPIRRHAGANDGRGVGQAGTRGVRRKWIGRHGRVHTSEH